VASGRTIVLTTQILSEAEELCDDILIIDKGRQVARGDVNALKLLSDRVYDLTITFEGCPRASKPRRRLSPLRTTISRNTVQVAIRDEEVRVLALASALVRLGRVLRVEIDSASLEDVFIELTGRNPRRDRADCRAGARRQDPRDQPDVHLLGPVLPPRLPARIRRWA
jgi:ABC-2 type transport system ATP-binding protein